MKYQAGQIDRSRSGGSYQVRRYTITIHYLYNITTGATAQVKLKNSFTDGCVGVWVQAQNMDPNGGDLLVARPAYDYNGNFDSVWSAYNYNIVVGPLTESYDVGCVHVDSVLPDGRRAGDIKVGDRMELGDEKTFDSAERMFKSSTGIVTYSKRETVPGVRITTKGGTSLVCSTSAPIPTETGLIHAPLLMGHAVPVKTSIEAGAVSGWDEVVKIESVGLIDVQHITVGDRCFWAGETDAAFILHHNLKAFEAGPSESFWPWWW